MCLPANRDTSLDGMMGDLILRYVHGCLEIKERTEGRGFCWHSGANSSSFPADVPICSSSLWWTVILYRFQNTFRHKGFFMLPVQLIFCLLSSYLYLSVKKQAWPFTKSDWNLFLTPSILQTEVQWSPSGVSCFEVNTSSVYLNKELENLNILCTNLINTKYTY